MIINGKGLVSAPQNLFERFFVGKATEHILGEGIEAKLIFDDRLGRVLEQLYELRLTQLFVKVALEAASKFGVNRQSLHLDSSSFHVDRGDQTKRSSLSKQPAAITITHGYSL